MDDILQEEGDEIHAEFARHQIQIPEDDTDDDDEEDDYIERVIKRRRNRPTRGSGIYGTQ